tara:strand:+ start:79 stop:327 length:249 start_codon:yes stop_codon:yes gene_type:complete
MSIPAPKNQEETYVHDSFLNELNTKKCSPLPRFTKSLEEAAWLRFRVDAILEEWIFPETGQKLPNPPILSKFDHEILLRKCN